MKKKLEVEVVKATFWQLKKGDHKIRCDMNDGSVWEYDKEYKNWKCLKPSDAELNQHFQAFKADTL